jgi:hypothetical protein
MPHGDDSSWCQVGQRGRQFWPLDPLPEDVHIEDVAYGLSRISRFGGHTIGEPYSVAQHSVLVSRALPDRLALCGQIDF